VSALPWAAVAALLVAAALLEEAAVWFGRNALDRMESDEEEAACREFARSARQARLLGRFLVSGALVGLAGASVAAPERYPLPAAFVIAALWALGGAGLSAVHWRSPLGLAGRMLFRPLEVLAHPLRWALVTWQKVPGVDRVLSAGERVVELDHELRWLTGDTGDDEEGNLLTTLHEFGEALVEDVMVPREEVMGIPAEARIPEMLELVAREGYSRYPVHRESPDAVVGVLHVFDLLSAGPEATAGSLAHEPYFTNATKPAGTLLRELQVTYNQMAVVVDEYGGVAGVITVEDLLEELVGEIGDELDVEEEVELKRLEPGVYWVDAAMRVDDLNEALDLDLEEGEYDTVAGLMLDHLERIPRPGERVRVDGVWLEVAQAEPQRINALRLTLIDKEKAGETS
jgi:CBS domain containing-hemolysin-like protein